jgi:catechol 2,3-dioxygenase-like lactoylglutathione lyase family enzyme
MPRNGAGRVERRTPSRYIRFRLQTREQSVDAVPPVMTPLTMTRVILYVRDVERLKNFYRTHFGLPVIEEITGEWAVLTGGGVELALHLVGEPYRNTTPGAGDEDCEACLHRGVGTAGTARHVAGSRREDERSQAVPGLPSVDVRWCRSRGERVSTVPAGWTVTGAPLAL